MRTCKKGVSVLVSILLCKDESKSTKGDTVQLFLQYNMRMRVKTRRVMLCNFVNFIALYFDIWNVDLALCLRYLLLEGAHSVTLYFMFSFYAPLLVYLLSILLVITSLLYLMLYLLFHTS